MVHPPPRGDAAAGVTAGGGRNTHQGNEPTATVALDAAATLDVDRLVAILRTTDQRSPMEVAHGLAALGVTVVASVTGDKAPLLTAEHTNGCDACRSAGFTSTENHGETTDPSVIDQLWNVHPDAGVLMKTHSQLLRGDLDAATGDELRAARRKLGYGKVEPLPFEASTPGGTYRRRYLHFVPDGQIIAGGGTRAFGVAWCHASGLVMVKGRHPNGLEYRPFLGSKITPVPVALREALSGRYSANGDTADAASSADVRKFLARHTGITNLRALDDRRRMVAKAPPGSRHPSAVANLVYGFEEAVAGYYPAQVAHDAIRTALQHAGWDSTRLGKEYDDLAAWAVAQVATLTPDEAYRRIAQRDMKYEQDIAESRPDPGDDAARDLTIEEIDDLYAKASGRHTDDNEDAPSSTLRDDLLTTNQVKALPPPEYLVDRLLVAGTVAWLIGKWGLGKSFYAVALALSIAAGRPFYGRTVRPGAVLYVVAEGVDGMGKRIDAWERHNNVTTYSHGVYWLKRAVNLHDPAAAGQLRELAAELGVTLVIIDTLNRCMVGADENSNRDAGVVVEQLARIVAATGATVLALHHPGKDATKGGRGASAFIGAMDTEIEMTGDQHLITVKVTKQKDGPEGECTYFRRVAVEGDSCILEEVDGRGEDAAASALGSLTSLREVYSDTPVTSSLWKDATGASTSTIARHAKRLLELELIRNVGSEHRPAYLPIREDGTWPG
jgi:AAA domain/Bifunctional DNA primase/polymerase, N-terminal